MISLSPDQRSRLMFVLLVAAGVLALLWFGVVLPLKASVETAARSLEAEGTKLQLNKTSAARAEEIREEVQKKTEILNGLEATMPDAAVLDWVFAKAGQLDQTSRIKFRAPEGDITAEPDLPPSVPYAHALCSISGIAEYQDIGAFVAELENSSPFVRVKQLTLSRSLPGMVSEEEKLGFRVEWITLVRTNASAAPTAAARPG